MNQLQLRSCSFYLFYSSWNIFGYRTRLHKLTSFPGLSAYLMVLFLILCFQAILAAMVENIRELILWNRNLSLFNNVYEFSMIIVPSIIVAPRYFSGQVRLSSYTCPVTKWLLHLGILQYCSICLIVASMTYSCTRRK
jgi:hypothetical protein